MGRTGSNGTTSRARMFILEDVSNTGARIVGDAPIAPGTPLGFDVPGTSMKGAGIVRHVQSLRTSLAVLFSMGVEFQHTPNRWMATLRRALPSRSGTNEPPRLLPATSSPRNGMPADDKGAGSMKALSS